MSVPSTERSHGKLEVLVKALGLTTYTLQITANEKVFVPQYQRAITDRINETAIDIYISLWTANNVLVKDGRTKSHRREYQDNAALQCNNLLAQMMIAQRVFHLDTKRIKYWGTLTIDTRNMIRAWIESDYNRFKDI